MINKQKKGITYNPKYHSEEQQDISSSKKILSKILVRINQKTLLLFDFRI